MSPRPLSTPRARSARIVPACAVAGATLLLLVSGQAYGQPEGKDASSDADSGKPIQILLIPIGGEMLEGSSGLPAKLTRATSDAIRAQGAEPVNAKVGADEIAAVAGCPAESRECFDLIASTVDVSEVVFGTVEPAESGTGVDVVLTSVRPNETPWQRRVHLEAQDEDRAVAAFSPMVSRFLQRQEPQEAPDLTVKEPQPPPPPALQLQPDRSPFSIRRVKPYAWALTGGGALLIGTGIYMFMKAADKQDELDDAPDQTVSDLARMEEIENDGKRYTSLGNGFVISGAAIAIAGIALGARQAMTRPEQRPPTTTVAPVALRGGAGLSVVFRGDL